VAQGVNVGNGIDKALAEPRLRGVPADAQNTTKFLLDSIFLTEGSVLDCFYEIWE